MKNFFIKIKNKINKFLFLFGYRISKVNNTGELVKIHKYNNYEEYKKTQVYFNKKNRVLSQKLLEKPKVDGFILLHLKQLSYSGRIDLVLIKKIIQQKYELYFCKEDLDLLDMADFKKNIKNFLIFDNTKKLVDLKK